MTADAHGNFAGKHLVIFGAGYVGSTVAHGAVERGMRVTALTRNAEKAEALRQSGVEVVVADLASPSWHDQIVGGAEFVLNCVSSGGGGVAGYAQSYLEGMESIVAWMRARGSVGTIVYTSSTSVYPQDGGVFVDEKAATTGSGERAQILLAAEKVLDAAGSLGACARWFVLRLAGIYGPGRHHLLEQVRAGEVAGRGDYRLNLVHRDDIAAAIWAAFGADGKIANEIFNVADDGAATKSEIVLWLAERLGVATPSFTGEPAPGRRAVTPDRVITNAKLKTVLGWRPGYPSFREGYTAILSA
jgi:nucleoside-diphosphate-sugar epimerase